MSAPWVTIITPSLNQGHFLRATIESVLGQCYENLEYIIMDGGSTDETAAIAASYANRLEFISEPDRGQAHAINKGFRRARGEIVAWLNSDDTLEPGAVAKAVEALDAHPAVAAIYGDGHQMDRDGRMKQRFPFTEPFNLWKLTFLMDYILQQTVFFRRDMLEEAGWLDESLHYGMDWDVLVRLGKRHGLVYVPEFMGNIREYEEAKSLAGGHKRFRELASILRRHTGRRFPPGWWFYGLDTYDKIVAGAIRRYLPRMPGEWLASQFITMCRSAIAHTELHSQGLYADGWVGPDLHWMTPAGHRKLEILGKAPDGYPGLSQQILAVSVGAAAAVKTKVQGEFRMEYALQGNEAVCIRIQSARSVAESGPATVPGGRRLAWKMLEIRSC